MAERLTLGDVPVRLRGLDRAPSWVLADAGGSIWKTQPGALGSIALTWVTPPVLLAWAVATWSPLAAVVVGLIGVLPAYAVIVAWALDVGIGIETDHLRAVRAARGRAGSLVLSTLAVLALGVVTLGIYFLYAGRLAALYPVVIAEGGGARQVLRRAFRLTRSNGGTFLIAMALSCIPGAVLAGAATLGLGAAASFVGAPVANSFGLPAVALLTALGSVLILPWLACTAAAVYLAGRQRVDGLDLQLQLRDAAVGR